MKNTDGTDERYLYKSWKADIDDILKPNNEIEVQLSEKRRFNDDDEEWNEMKANGQKPDKNDDKYWLWKSCDLSYITFTTDETGNITKDCWENIDKKVWLYVSDIKNFTWL